MKPSLGDIIRDGDVICTITNLFDIDGNETENAEEAVAIVAKGVDGWYTFYVDQLEHEARQ